MSSIPLPSFSTPSPTTNLLIQPKTSPPLWLAFLLSVGLFGFGCQRTSPPSHKKMDSSPENHETSHSQQRNQPKILQTTSQPLTKIPHKSFSKAAPLLRYLLRQRPTILGVGEYHQNKRFQHITPSIQHFTRSFLQPLAKQSTDLLVETWVTTGQCGTTEKRVVREVQKVTERPKKTETHVMKLLQKAKSLRIQPHILTVHCKKYPTLLDKKGQLDPLKALQVVTQKLAQKTTAILQYHQRFKKQRHPFIIIYGGALHNDTQPESGYEEYAYTTKFPKKLLQHYTELDLYVPEYIAADKDYIKKPWFPLLQKKERHHYLVYQRTPRSYVVLLPWSSLKP